MLAYCVEAVETVTLTLENGFVTSCAEVKIRVKVKIAIYIRGRITLQSYSLFYVRSSCTSLSRRQ
jgi:hypothetical protein